MGKCRKLSFRYWGPFEVLKRMWEQSYQLALPPQLHVHDVFHVNLLKKYVPNPGHILDLYDNVLVNQEEFWMEVELILKTWEKQLRNQVLRDVLVQWKGYPVEDASSKDWNKMIAQFPYLQRWFIFSNPTGISHSDFGYLLLIKETYDLVWKFDKLTINRKPILNCGVL